MGYSKVDMTVCVWRKNARQIIFSVEAAGEEFHPERGHERRSSEVLPESLSFILMAFVAIVDHSVDKILLLWGKIWNVTVITFWNNDSDFVSVELMRIPFWYGKGRWEGL